MTYDWFSDNWIEIFGAVTGVLYVFLEIRQNFWLWPVGIITSAVYVWVFLVSKFYADMSLQCYYLGISCLGWYWWAKGTGQGAGIRGPGAEGRGQKARGREQGAGSWGQGAESAGHEAVVTGQRAGSGEQGAETAGHEAGGPEQMAEIAGKEAEGRGQGAESEGQMVEDRNEGLRVTRLKLKTGVILAAAFAAIYLLIWLFLIGMTDSPVPGWDAFITSLSIVATWMLARKIYEHWFLWLIVNSVSMIIFIIKGLYPTVILYFVYFIMSFAGLKEWKRSL